MEGSGTDLLAVYITSIHIVLYQSASCYAAAVPFFLGEAEQLPLRHSGLRPDEKVRHLPSAI